MYISSLAAALTDLDMPTINKLLTALNECTEWGQVFILDSLADYRPESEQEAQNICERVTPRLSHANAAVVLSAVKVCLHYVYDFTIFLVKMYFYIMFAIGPSSYQSITDIFVSTFFIHFRCL